MKPSKKRIIALTHEFFPRRGGIATYVGETARAAAEAGLCIEVWAPRHPALEVERYPFSISMLPLKGSQDWSCRLRLARELLRRREEWRDALLYLAEPGPIATWMYMQDLLSPPVGGLVVVLHGSEVRKFTSLPHLRGLFGRLLARSDRIGIVSRFVGAALLSRFPSLEPKIVLSPGAVRSDVHPARPYAERRSASRSFVLLTVARIHPRKGQDVVLEALSRLPAEIRNRIEYRLIGPIIRPAYFRKLERFALANSLNLRYLGAVDDNELGAAYADADIFIMAGVPYHHSVEGFGLAYLEASAHGLPVIGHRIGGVEDAVRDGESGILIDPEDRDGLARAISDLVDSPERRRTLGAGGQRWSQRFSWHATARTLFQGFD